MRLFSCPRPVNGSEKPPFHSKKQENACRNVSCTQFKWVQLTFLQGFFGVFEVKTGIFEALMPTFCDVCPGR
jgi:hypothetical protein